ncbi:MAG TPA: outer membrane lipoprotein carrier protein LolA [Pyrinomonadaceae bacterium]|nr:outer membrane lipoprotein carrier protein LolA [Pyrinomonadaceae bacterium]
MSKFLRVGFTAIALTFVFGAFAVSETNAQINKTLTRMDEFYKSLQSLQANITMEKYNVQIDEKDVYQGKVWYVPAKGKEQMAIRLDWSKPTEENLLVINGLYRLVRPRLKTEYRGKVEKAKNNANVAGPLSFMSMSKKQLTDNYEVAILGAEKLSDGTETIHLKLTPKTAQKYKMAEVWVDGNGKPLQMKVVEKNGDSTTVLLTNSKDNVTIDPAIWIINAKGLKVIDN